MPLRCHGWISGGQIIKTTQNTSSSTYRATSAAVPIVRRGFPFVALRTQPPHFLVGAGSHLSRREIPVLAWVPLRRQIRVRTCQVIDSPHQFPHELRITTKTPLSDTAYSGERIARRQAGLHHRLVSQLRGVRRRTERPENHVFRRPRTAEVCGHIGHVLGTKSGKGRYFPVFIRVTGELKTVS